MRRLLAARAPCLLMLWIASSILPTRGLAGQETAPSPSVAELAAAGWNALAQGDLEGAGESFRRAAALCEGRESDLDAASSLAGLAMVRQQEGDLAGAEELYLRSAGAFEASGHPEHADRGAVLKNLADLLAARGHLAEAEALYRDVLSIWIPLFGEGSEWVDAVEIQVAGLLQSQGRDGEALKIYDAAYLSYRARFGELDPRTLELLQAVVSTEVSLGHFEAAMERTRVALEGLGSGDGRRSREVASLLDTQARIDEAAGRLGRAIEEAREALAMAEEVAGEEIYLVEGIRIHLATLLREVAAYEEADELYDSSRRRLEEADLASGTFYGTLLHEEGRLRVELADAPGARRLFERALELYREALGEQHFFVATARTSLAALALEEEEFETAIEQFERALEIYRGSLGERNVYTARALGNLGAALQKAERLDEARAPIDRCVELLTELLGRSHPDTAYYVNNRAVLALAGKRFEEARGLLLEALGVAEPSLGAGHPAVARIRHNLAYVEGILGHSDRSLELFLQTLGEEADLLPNVFSVTSERQKLAYLERASWTYHRFLALVVDRFGDDPQILRQGLDVVLARKGIVIDALSRREESLRTSLEAEEADRFEELGETRGALARLLLSPSPSRSTEDLRGEVDALASRVERLEAELARSSPWLAGEWESRRISAQAVAEGLEEGSVLLEVVRFREVDWQAGRWSKDHRYVAFVLGTQGEIRLVDLGLADDLDERVSGLLRNLEADPWSDRGRRRQRAAMERLYDRLFSPLESAVAGAARIFVSPDGSLHLLPWAALVDGEGRFLVERFSVGYLTSGRDLLASLPTRENEEDLLLLADPEFGISQPSPAEGTDTEATRASPFAAWAAAGLFPLPGTRLEAEQIPDLLPGERKRVLSGPAAREEALLEASRPRVLHLATHGFFLPPSADTAAGDGAPRLRLADHPLARSGLALAGARDASGARDHHDGIVTALEVTSMNLRGTDLVTLSACDTGRGEVRSGEGVFGLRRAFALAGARHLLMSLWPVADETTAEQMLTFYRLYGEGKSPAEALRRAQMETIERLKQELGEAPPSLWAPFALEGP